MSEHATDGCGPLLFVLLASVLPKCTYKMGICKFHGLHIEAVITIQATITNNTDYSAGMYFVIMFFKIL